MSIRRAAERDGGDLGADHENSCAAVVLGEILGETEDGAAGEAALLVHHQSLDGRTEAEEFGELVVRAAHVDAAGGAEDEVGDLRLGQPPFLYGLRCCFLAEPRDLDRHHVLPRVEGGGHVGADFGVLFQDLFGQVHVTLLDHRLLTCNHRRAQNEINE